MLLRCEIHPAVALRCILFSQNILIAFSLLLTVIPIEICSFLFFFFEMLLNMQLFAYLFAQNLKLPFHRASTVQFRVFLQNKW